MEETEQKRENKINQKKLFLHWIKKKLIKNVNNQREYKRQTLHLISFGCLCIETYKNSSSNFNKKNPEEH